jgi:hypothetical protein
MELMTNRTRVHMTTFIRNRTDIAEAYVIRKFRRIYFYYRKTIALGFTTSHSFRKYTS